MIERQRKSVLEIGGQEVLADAPGLKKIKRISKTDLYWAADEEGAFKGYLPRTVRIHVDLSVTEPGAVAQTLTIVEEVCKREQQAMLSWADGHRDDRERLRPKFDGTVGSLARLYRWDEESGFQQLKSNTQDNYAEWLGIIEKTIGARRVDRITAKWFRTCFKMWAGTAEYLRRAYGCIQMVKNILDYGVQADLPHCWRLRQGMEKIRFPKNGPREEAMSFAHARAVVELGLRKMNVSMALVQAIQWDGMLRQKDVVGEWRRVPEGYITKPGEIRSGSRVWSGLTIDRIAPGASLVVRTTKTSQPVSHLIAECPLIMRCMPFIDRSIPDGPVAISSSGLPWGDHRSFGKAWRRLADEAGVPAGVWNMDARAGGVTEASAGGASDDDLASNAGHATKSTTRRIYKRKADAISRRVQKSRRVAREATDLIDDRENAVSEQRGDSNNA